MFGNTSVLSVLSSPLLRKLARACRRASIHRAMGCRPPPPPISSLRPCRPCLPRGGRVETRAGATGVTLTWFWGLYGTLVPRPRKILGVVGQPLGVPSTPVAAPTQQQIDELHAKYLAEVTRIFESYKPYNADYKDKALQFES